MFKIANFYERSKLLLPKTLLIRLAIVKRTLFSVIKFLIHRIKVARLYAAVFNPMAPGIGQRATGRKVIMLVYSDLRVDPRVEREARTLAQAGYDILVVCPTLDKSVGDPPLDWGGGVSFQLLPVSAWGERMERPGYEGLKMYEATLPLAMKIRPFAIHAHDLNTCLVAWAISHQTGAHLVADFHEWTSENVHWDSVTNGYIPYPNEWKKQLQGLERSVLKHASTVITVCDSIADAIKEELGGKKRPTVVRNIPIFNIDPTRLYPDLKAQFGLTSDSFVLLYQGGTGPARLLEPIIQALEFSPRCNLIIRGPSLGQFGAGYKALAKSIGVESRLYLAGPVPSKDVVAAARGADAGIWSLPPLCRNFTLALPNKLFEYLSADLPVVAANYPEVSKIISVFEIGNTFDPYDPRSIANSINYLIENPTDRLRMKSNVRNAMANLNASAEWAKVVGVYESLRHY